MWNEAGFHSEPIVVLNLQGFFDPLMALLDHLAAEGFLESAHRANVLIAGDPATALDLVVDAAARNPRVWSGAGEQPYEVRQAETVSS